MGTEVSFVDRLSKIVQLAAASAKIGALECAKILRHEGARLHGMRRNMVSDWIPGGKESSGLKFAASWQCSSNGYSLSTIWP